MTYLIQVSNHPRGNQPSPVETEVGESWQTWFDGPCRARDAKRAAKLLTSDYRHVRVFRGGTVGKLWYEVSR